MKKVLTIILLLLLIAGATGVGGFKYYITKETAPLIAESEEFQDITIPVGTGTKAIAKILKENGLIGNERVFWIKAKLDDLDGKFQAGDYSLSPSMSMEELMSSLLSGRKDTERFTIPEGLDIGRTAETLVNNDLVEMGRFLEEVEHGDFDYWFIEKLPKNSQRLEGVLFPETYEIYIGSDEHSIIDKMLGQFNKVFTEEHIARMEELNMDFNDVMTLASIIEREALISEDRPIISGVFLNRLEIGMALQSCATVQYILGEQKPVLSTADTQIESPYNTYIYKGLPPGPICSPGKESIDAALWPVETDYLFFLAKGDGSHVFSKTYEEHLKYKAKYID